MRDLYIEEFARGLFSALGRRGFSELDSTGTRLDSAFIKLYWQVIRPESENFGINPIFTFVSQESTMSPDHKGECPQLRREIIPDALEREILTIGENGNYKLPNEQLSLALLERTPNPPGIEFFQKMAGSFMDFYSCKN